MSQLIGVLFSVIASLALMVMAYRYVGFNEGKSETWKAVWWWVTAVAAIALVVSIITGGAVIQRIYF